MKNEMLLNKKKCGIFKLKKRAKKYELGKDLKIIDDEPKEYVLGIPLVGIYKYLGIVFDDAMTANPHTLYLMTKMAKFKRICMNVRI